MNSVYLHFAFRHFKKENRMVVATGIYADEHCDSIISARILEVKPWADNKDIRSAQAYANALQYIYSIQDKLIDMGVSTVVIVTDKTNIYRWLVDEETYKDKWMELATKPFRNGASNEIKLNMALGELCERSAVYKYCRLDKIDANIRITNHGIRVMTEEEAKKKEDKRLEEQRKEEEGLCGYTVSALLEMYDNNEKVNVTGIISGGLEE